MSMQLQLAVHLAAVLAAHALPWAGSASAAALTSAPPPFSFTLGGELFASNVATPSRSSWALQTASFAQPGGRECTDFTWTDNATGLQVTAAQTAYTGAAMAGAREWVLSFRNTGHSPSPPLCNVSAVDTKLTAALLGGAPTVHRFVGSHAGFDYLPIVYPVPAWGAAPAPQPGPPAPAPKRRLVHGNASASQMATGYRIWCTKPGDDCARGMRRASFQTPTGQACQAACAGNATCMGCTWVVADQLCFLLAVLDSTDPEAGYDSWSRIPVAEQPHGGGGGGPLVGPTFAPDAGRSSNGVLPYFAVFGEDAGVVYSVGWSGGWEGQVFLDKSTAAGVAVRVMHASASSAGTLCASLSAGESFRSMRIIAVPFAKGEAAAVAAAQLQGAARPYGGLVAPSSATQDSDRALEEALHLGHPLSPPGVPVGGYNGLGAPTGPGGFPQVGFNKHRRIMSEFKLPRDPKTGEVHGAMVASWAWIGWAGHQDEEDQLWHAEAVKNTTVEYYWLDAGWFNGGFPNGVGNWQIPLSDTVLRANWPNASLAPLGEACHAEPNPVGFIVWFEPERVHPGTYIASTFPEYVLHGPPASSPDGLLNLGDGQARGYIQRYLSDAVEEYGLDVLRIDYNIDPGPIWAASDEPGRGGITEVKYINGLYTLWDAILASHPGLMIDDCSSGGRRIDIETLSRSFPLWRSDNAASATAIGAATLQVQSMGLTQLAPISSGAAWDVDPYNWRSAGIFGKTISWGRAGWQRIMGNQTLIAQLKLAVSETKSLREFMLEDFYPLTATNVDLAQWAAYQFHRPAASRGQLQAGGGETATLPEAGFALYFRRPQSALPSMPSGLLALDPAAAYSVTLYHNYVSDSAATTLTGVQLAAMSIALDPNKSLLLRYSRTAG